MQDRVKDIQVFSDLSAEIFQNLSLPLTLTTENFTIPKHLGFGTLTKSIIMESMSPFSNNSTHQLECKACGKVFKHSWDLNRHLLSRKQTGGNSTGLDCVPVRRRGCKAQDPISRLKSAHLEEPRINSPEEGQNLPQRIKSHARKSAKEKLNEHEKAFMKEQIRIEERKVGENLVRLEMVLKTDVILQTELATLQGELEYSNKLIWHFRDMLH